MSYKLLKDYPGVPAGELMELDNSNPDHLVYRSPNYPDFWASKDMVETSEHFGDVSLIYYFIDEGGDIQEAVDKGTEIDLARQKFGNYFPVKADAIAAQIIIKEQLKP